MITFRSLREFDASEGTVTLLDVDHRLKTKGDIILIPQPSDDINDPLNWPLWKKALAFIPVLIFTTLGNWSIAGLGIAIPTLIGEFRHSFFATAQDLNGLCVLLLGAGNFFWIPTALYFGKRPAFLVSSTLFFASIVWCAKATSFGSLEAARIICAFAASITEGLGSAISSDLFFLHERGWWMGLYIFALNFGATAGSIMSGFLIQHAGWRWHLWLCAIIAGVNVIFMFLFFPETTYYRKNVTGDPQNNSESHEIADNGESHEIADNNESKETAKETATEAAVATAIPKKSYLQQLKPWSPLNPNASYLSLIFRPWPLIIYPAVIFSFLIFSTTLAWIVCVVNTNAVVFQSPPYSMSPGINGLINVPAIIGVLLGSFAGGALTDMIAKMWAKKNNGIFEPEFRLIALVFPFFIVPTGLLMYGIGIQRLDSWAVPWIGYGCLVFGLSSVPAIVMTYVIDSYYPVAFECLLLVNGLKNMFAFGFSYGVVPWVTRSGFQHAFGEMIVIQTGVMLFAVPLFIYGKKLRHISAGWKVISW